MLEGRVDLAGSGQHQEEHKNPLHRREWEPELEWLQKEVHYKTQPEDQGSQHTAAKLIGNAAGSATTIAEAAADIATG